MTEPRLLSPPPEGVLELDTTDGSRFRSNLDGARNYPKMQSMIMLQYLGLPVLRGVAVSKWDARIEKYVIAKLRSTGAHRLVIRTDKHEEIGMNIPRGGYDIGIDEVGPEVSKYLGAGRVVMLLEPRDRFDNLYGINAYFDLEDGFKEIRLEIVGPGFDVSDLNRGDISPHEQIVVERRDATDRDWLSRRRMKISVISPDGYRKSVHARLRKIGLGLTTGGRMLGLGADSAVARATAFLRETGHTLLFDHAHAFSPIPFDQLAKVLDTVAFLPEQLAVVGIPESSFVVSMSVMRKARELVCWDLVWPNRKYFPTLLARYHDDWI